MAKTKKDQNEADAGESQDDGDPTEDVEEGDDTTPDGQTDTGDVVSDGGAEFAPAENRPRLERRNPEENEKTPKVAGQLAKALGLRGSSDVLSYNERTRTAVFSNGGKFQISKDGKSIRHLAGPRPPEDLKLNVIDARMRSSLRGAAAQLNAQGD